MMKAVRRLCASVRMRASQGCRNGPTRRACLVSCLVALLVAGGVTKIRTHSKQHSPVSTTTTTTVNYQNGAAANLQDKGNAMLVLPRKNASRDDDVLVQVVSDLHVEFYGSADQIPSDLIQRQAPVLALVGDIGLAFTDTLRDFLHQQADKFEQVLFLAGNHEFYNTRGTKYTVQEQVEWLKQVCSEKSNLHFLERQAVEIDGVLILGTTLWSHIPSSVAEGAARSMNDYQLSYIQDSHGHTIKMTPDFTSQWHTESVQWLERQLDEAEKLGQPVIVLTHHTPSMKGTSNPRYDGDDMSHCFSTDLTRLLLKPAVRFWVSGHTHFNFDLNFPHSSSSSSRQTRLLSNQRGYPGQDKKDYDNEGAVLRVSPPPPRK